MVWALRDAPAPDPGAQVVLIGLANHAHSDGTAAFPRISVLAEYCQCSERTVHRKLNDLLEAGVIMRGDQRYVAHLRSDRRPVVYDLNLGLTRGDRVSPPESRETYGVTAQVARGDSPGTHGVTTVSDRTVLEPSLEPSLEPIPPSVVTSPARRRAREPETTDSETPSRPVVATSQEPEGFEQFWEVWPIKEAQVAARTAYRRALTMTDPRTLLRQAVAYAATRDDPRYATRASKWLAEQRWTDVYPPVLRSREEYMHTQPPLRPVTEDHPVWETVLGEGGSSGV